jgi:hypothetical protein
MLGRTQGLVGGYSHRKFTVSNYGRTPRQDFVVPHQTPSRSLLECNISHLKSLNFFIIHLL